jgi:hypothetical protein
MKGLFVDMSKSIKKISDELLDKTSGLSIIDTRKKLNKTKEFLVTVSDLLEDIPEDSILKLNEQLDIMIEFLTKTKKLIF